MRKLNVIASMIALMSVLCFSAFASGAQDSAAATGPDVDYSETAYLNMTQGTNYNTDTFNHPWFIQQTDNYLFQSLIKYDTYTEEFIPYLAESFSVSDDKMTYTFVIGDDTYWHDGQKVTAEDVKWSFDGIAKLSSFTKYITGIVGAQDVIDGNAESISGITIDGNVVTIKLNSVDTTFLFAMSNNLLSILPKHAFEGVAIDDFFTYTPYLEKPIGSGPYMVDEMQLPDFVTLTRFDRYNGEPAGVKHIMRRTYTTHEAALAAMLAGDLDWSEPNAVIESDIALLSRNEDLEFHYVESLYTRFLMCNVSGAADGSTTGDLEKPEVRQALNLLLDKEVIAEIVGGGATVLNTMINPNSSYYNDEIAPFERDVDKAVSMLEAAGYDFDHTIRIATAYSDQVAVDVMEYVKQNLADAGIKSEYSVHTTNVADILWESRTWDLWYGANNAELEVDPFRTFSTPYVFDRVMLGTEEYREENYNRRIEEYTSTLSSEEREAAVDALQAQYVEDMFFLPLYTLNSVRIVNAARVEGIPVFGPGKQYTGFRHWEDWRMISK